MSKNDLLAFAAILLIILGGLMIYLGVKASMLPPGLTGAGFIIIALVFLGIRNR